MKKSIQSIIDTAKRKESPSDRVASMLAQSELMLKQLYHVEAIVEPKVNDGPDAVRTANPDEVPQFWGVYVHCMDGRKMHVKDYSVHGQALTLCEDINNAFNLLGI